MSVRKTLITGIPIMAISAWIILAGCVPGGVAENSPSIESPSSTHTQMSPVPTGLTITPVKMEETPINPEVVTPVEATAEIAAPVQTMATATQTEAAKTSRPTRTPYPTRTPRPTKTATRTPTPLPPPIHDSPIRIFSPSSISKVTSPFLLNAAVVPGSGGTVYMELIGEDGTILFQKKWTDYSTVGWRMNINEKIEFTPRVPAESARLVIYTLDEYRRYTALATEQIILLQFGKAEALEPDNLKDPFALFKPYPDQILKNGLLVVDGGIRCRVDCRLLFEMIDRSGRLIARFEETDVIQASLDYTLVHYEYKAETKSPTWVRLLMHQQDIFTGEDIAISSMNIRVDP